MDAPLRAPAHGPALIDLLVRIDAAAAAPPSRSVAASLGQWVDWRQAVTLSAALAPRPPWSASEPPAGDGGECARVQATLIGTIDGDRAFAAATARASEGDGAFYRQRYTALQRVMAAEIRHLRERLRGRLAQHSAEFDRLAAVDAVLEQAVGAREQALLASIPDRVGAHFERLRQAAPDGAAASSAAWLGQFHADMRALLLAELALRMQPAEALAAALGPQTTGSDG